MGLQVLDIVRHAGNGGTIKALASAVDLPPDATEAALSAILPVLARAIERNTLNRGGVADLVAALGAASHERILAPGSDLGAPQVTEDGNAILGHILGSRDRSRAVAARVAGETGIAEATIKKLLPLAASLLMGALAKGSRDAIGNVMRRIPALSAGSPLPLPGEPPRDLEPSAPQSAPPRRDGGNVGHQAPLPVPGNTIPDDDQGTGNDDDYGDLSDIIRRGGYRIPRPAGGGAGQGGNPDPGGSGDPLETIIRNILGNLLGFESKGFWGWLVRLILIRWGWGLVKRILSRIFLGR